MEPGGDPKKNTLRYNVSEQERLGTRILENMINAYIVNGLADEYDTQRQLLDSDTIVTRGKIDSMIATSYEERQTERSGAGSRALEVSFKEAASVQQCCKLCQKPYHTARVCRSFECKQVPFSGKCTPCGRRESTRQWTADTAEIKSIKEVPRKATSRAAITGRRATSLASVLTRAALMVGLQGQESLEPWWLSHLRRLLQ